VDIGQEADASALRRRDAVATNTGSENVMARRPWLPLGKATAAALLVAGGLGIWSAERAAEALGVGAPVRARPSAGRRPLEAAGAPRGAPVVFMPAPVRTSGAPVVPPEEGAPPLRASATLDSGDPVRVELPAGTDAERLASAELADGLGRLVRDLEYNRELPEPPQQTVRRLPAPWRPIAGDEPVPAPVIDAIDPATGPVAGGARVTIRGHALRPGQVMFGSTPAQVVSASADTIAVVAPSGVAGPVQIAVTNEDGSFAVGARPFTYVGR
jgi:hypothetical protein